MSNRLKKQLAVVYTLFLIFGFFYVKKVLNQEQVAVIPRSNQKQTTKVRNIDVTFVFVENGVSTQYRYNSFVSADSVNDLLEQARSDGHVYYEIITYTNGVAILVDDKPAPMGNTWKVFYNKADITNQINSTKLIDNGTYILKQV